MTDTKTETRHAGSAAADKTKPAAPRDVTAPQDRSALPDLNALQDLVATLSARVQLLEVQALESKAEVSEETLLAIAAACAAYLGHRAKIKQVHLRRGGAWASQGRSATQLSHADLLHDR